MGHCSVLNMKGMFVSNWTKGGCCRKRVQVHWCLPICGHFLTLIAPMLITACWLFKFILFIWLSIGGFQLLLKGDFRRKNRSRTKFRWTMAKVVNVLSSCRKQRPWIWAAEIIWLIQEFSEAPVFTLHLFCSHLFLQGYLSSLSLVLFGLWFI